MSASASTMMASLPPISRMVRLIQIWPGACSAARLWISIPTSRESVKAIKRVFGWATRALPNVVPEPGQKLTTPSGMPAISSNSTNLRAMVGESLDGFSTHRKHRTIRGHGHARHDGARKIPRRNHRTRPQGNVEQRIALAGQLHWELARDETQSFARIKLAEVDGFRDVSVGFHQFLLTSKTRQAQNSNFALACSRSATRNSRLARSSTGVRLQDAKACSAACSAGSTCSMPAFWCTPTTCEGMAGLMDLDLVLVRDPLAADDQLASGGPVRCEPFRSQRASYGAAFSSFVKSVERLVDERPFMERSDVGGRRLPRSPWCTSDSCDAAILNGSGCDRF